MEIYFSDLKAEKSEKCNGSFGVWWGQASWFIGGSHFLLWPHMVKAMGELSMAHFTEGLMPFMRTPLSWPNHLPKALPLNTITLNSNKWIFLQGDINIQSIEVISSIHERADYYEDYNSIYNLYTTNQFSRSVVSNSLRPHELHLG